MDNCIFCEIVKGEMPAYVIYEDELLIGILNIEPDRNGHILLIPKEHYADFIDIPDELVLHINRIMKASTPEIMAALGSESIAWRFNYGTSQTVKHFHVHGVPNILLETEEIKPLEEVYHLLKK